ncbi:hypothetical protein CDAR_185581 [Caerostris darwini]|uniref:Uncharacterized protein n=1 Tax=Caerostris darwini TaxID=1538125 RepID=A0AAV4T851_9ARAC|nr:hypothetical protein CDAR_185581 [Caerostris darwini]
MRLLENSLGCERQKAKIERKEKVTISSFGIVIAIIILAFCAPGGVHHNLFYTEGYNQFIWRRHRNHHFGLCTPGGVHHNLFYIEGYNQFIWRRHRNHHFWPLVPLAVYIIIFSIQKVTISSFGVVIAIIILAFSTPGGVHHNLFYTEGYNQFIWRRHRNHHFGL